ncbi:MAG TPA: glycolate oxidase subunit GlcE [Steroidobacteraceae bacterium]|nr:glycolate oxidase subunit GlcE [Steroidobacteraceae bacterium]
MPGGDQSILDEWRQRIAAASAARAPLRLRGAGTKDFYGETLTGEILELSGWRGIVDYDPSELVITARCGTPLSEVEATLGAREQILAFEPPAFGADPTIGGVIAAGLSGPRRPYAGAARDFVLGTRLLAASGEVLRFGGQVIKNVAGFDVSRLLCGSLGILGVITEVSLKVLPRPRMEQTLRLELPAAVAVESFNRWAALPLPLSAAAWWQGSAWVRLSGAAPAVRAACERIGGERVDATAAQAWWDALRHCRLPLFGSERLWRVSLPAAAAPLALAGELLIDWGGALRWYANPEGDADVRRLAAQTGGTALCWRGPAPQGRFHPLQPTVAKLHRRLKERFDPQGIFNPGRLVAGL